MKNASAYVMSVVFLILITQQCFADILNFNNMIRETTGRNPLDFNGYGCYCGLGGHGEPVDVLDRCCQWHDQCYLRLQQRKVCGRWGIYLSSYKTVKTLESSLTCKNANTRCGKEVCECDRTAALCFAKSPFNASYKKYNKKLC